MVLHPTFPSSAACTSHWLCWPLYVPRHGIKQLCNAFLCYTMEYPTCHLHCLSQHTRLIKGAHVYWENTPYTIYNLNTRYIFYCISLKRIRELAFILSYYRIIIHKLTALNSSVDGTLRNLVVPSFQVGRGRGYAAYVKQPTLQRRWEKYFRLSAWAGLLH